MSLDDVDPRGLDRGDLYFVLRDFPITQINNKQQESKLDVHARRYRLSTTWGKAGRKGKIKEIQGP